TPALHSFPTRRSSDLALRAYGVTLGELYDAVARSNSAVGGRTIQKNNADYLVRAVGWITSARDIEDVVVKQVAGTPVYVKNLARSEEHTSELQSPCNL